MSLQGRHIRFGPLSLPDSKQMRLKRLYPDAVYKQATDTVSLPRPTTARVGGWNLPVAGGAYLRLLPAPLFRWGFQRAVREGQAAVLYLHPWELDPDQPRLRVGWRTRLRHYTNLHRTEQRVQRLLSQTPFDTMGAVVEAREAAGRLPTRALEECIRRPARALVRLNELLIRLSRGLFAYQIFLVATPAPSLEALLDDSIETSRLRAEELVAGSGR